MIILTDKMLVIPVGISPNYAGAGKSDIKIQDSKDVTITENGSTTVVPDENFDVLTKVNITTDVNPDLENKSVEITENGDYNYTASAPYYGIGNFNVKVNVEIPVESSKTVNPSFNEDITVLPSEGFDAMSSVIVKKAEANLQDKTVPKASESQIVLTADEGYQGLGTVTIAPINITAHTVIPTSDLQLITADTNNNEYIIEVLVNGVPQRTLTVDPSTNEQTFNSNHLFGEFYSKVVVNPVTSSIDSNIVPENIAKGVSILGVEGTLDAALPSELQEIINKGPAFSSKIQVYSVYTEDKSTAYRIRMDSSSGAAGASGYIPFFMKNVKVNDYSGGYPDTNTLANSLGTLADRGIVAYTVNGVLYTNPTSFNIPYTKVNDGSKNYDDVTVDVYIDFTKANARAEIIENAFLSDNGITTPVDPSLFDVNTYRYLPPIINSNYMEHYENYSVYTYKHIETYVREQINALSALFISGNRTNSSGNITFFIGEDGLKRVPDALSQRKAIKFNNVIFYCNIDNLKNIKYWFNKDSIIYVYGNVNEFDGKDWFKEDTRIYVYGNVNGFDGIFYESSSNFFGNVNKPSAYFKKYDGKFYNSRRKFQIIDIGKYIDTNPVLWGGSVIDAYNGIMMFPYSLKYLYDNYKSSSYNTYTHSEIYVFFGATPPTLPDVKGNPQLLLQTGTTNISNNKLKTIYKPAGADYSSILDSTNPPTVIDFIPITSTTEVTGPGIYGLTYGDKGYHWLFEIKESAQGEQDLQTIANELNNL